MPVGKEMSSFSLTATSFTNLASDGGVMSAVGNFEGTVTGEIAGAVVLTLTLKTSDMKNGTYTSVAGAFLDNGDVLNGEGSGCYESTGAHKWRLRGIDVLSNGSIIAIEGDVELATRSYNGKVYAWN